MIGPLITTSGILLLVMGLIGASIEVYAQLTLELLQQQLSGIVQQQLSAILQEQGGGAATAGEDQGLLFEPTEVLRSLLENLLGNPLWLTLTLVGIGLIYLGLYIAQRQGSRRRV